MADSSQTRSEAASPRRREEARKRGQVTSSADLTSGLFLLAMLLLMRYAGGGLGESLVSLFQTDAPLASQRDWSAAKTVALGQASCVFLIGSTALMLVGGFAVALLANVLQIGLQLSPAALSFKPNRLSPNQGIKRIVSWRGLMRTSMGMTKFAAVLVAVTTALVAKQDSLLLVRHSLAAEVRNAWDLCLFTALLGTIALVVVGAVDFAFQRWRQDEDLKMTRQEVKDETKENEGNPQVRGRIRKLQAEAAKQRTLNDVPRATVVITNPTHLAIAIRYDRATMSAPVVVAKGEGIMAQRIRRRAVAAGVPVIERKPIARALYASTKVGSEIPTALYRAVAEILSHVYRLQRG